MTYITNNTAALPLEQTQCLNRIITLIGRGEVDSAKRVLSLKDNPLGEEMSNKILSSISSPQTAQLLRGASRDKVYDVLINGPQNFLENLQKNKTKNEIIISHVFFCQELLNRILIYVEPSASYILTIRLVNRYFSQAIFSLPLTWNMHFSHPPTGFQGTEKDSTLYLQCTKIDRNNKKGHFQQRTFDNQSFLSTDSNLTNFYFQDMHLNEDRLALVDSSNFKIKIWDLNKRELNQVIRCDSKSLWNSDFTVNPNIKMKDGYIYFSKGKTIGVWNLNKSNLPISSYKKIHYQNNEGTVQKLASSSTVLDMAVSCRNLYSLSDGILKTWDRETAQINNEITIDKAQALTQPKKILVRDRLIFGLAGRAIYVWDPDLAPFLSPIIS